MAEEVRQDLSGRGYAFFGRPPEPTKLQAFTAWLLVYGVYFTLYVLSYVFVFCGPFADFGPRIGVIVTVFFIAYLTFIFAVSWPIAVIIEIAIWADRSDR